MMVHMHVARVLKIKKINWQRHSKKKKEHKQKTKTVHKTHQRKLMSEQHEPHQKLGLSQVLWKGNFTDPAAHVASELKCHLRWWEGNKKAVRNKEIQILLSVINGNSKYVYRFYNNEIMRYIFKFKVTFKLISKK